jgi:hypothetical protein
MSFGARRSLIRETEKQSEETEMSKLIVTEFVTLDGVMEAPGFKLTDTQTFGSGVAVHTYEPA